MNWTKFKKNILEGSYWTYCANWLIGLVFQAQAASRSSTVGFHVPLAVDSIDASPEIRGSD